MPEVFGGAEEAAADSEESAVGDRVPVAGARDSIHGVVTEGTASGDLVTVSGSSLGGIPRSSRPVTADAGVQADLRTGQWRPSFSVTRAAQLLSVLMQSDTISTPEQLGRRTAVLLGIHPSRFVEVDLITAIAEGIAEYERRSAWMLYTQILPAMQVEGTGALGLYQVANELARRLQRRGETADTIPDTRETALPEPPIQID